MVRYDRQKLPITALLTVISFFFTVVLSIPLGVLAGSVRSRALDSFFTALDQVVMSIPAFFIGILACYIFGIGAAGFLAGGLCVLYRGLGPVHFLSDPASPVHRHPAHRHDGENAAGAILNEQGQDYVRTARSRGNSRRAILSRHVLKNALIPVITFLAVSAAEIMTGTIIIEQVFTIPGIGRLLLASISNRDFPVVQAIVVILAAWIVIVNFAADLLYQLADPRIRLR